jgi:N-acetylglucosaminyldiphosphoundecaprenol N-acetyl-beta-D-mannosaminyltransferase
MRKLLVVLGVPIDNLTMEEALARCDEFIALGRATGRTHQIATVNADFVVNSLHDPELQRILQESDMSTADGMPLVWGSRLLGGRLPGRVTGADMVPALAHRAAQKGYSIFFLGAREGIAAKAAAILQERNPGLKIAGVLSPPSRPILEMDRSVVEQVKAARPDILLVAFGNPKQEKWIRMYAHELQVPICIGVGGTFDMIVGITKRAPSWVQKSGLEWAYRLLQEPRRLAKRYLHDFGYFGYFFAHQWWAMRQGTAVSMAPPARPTSTTPVRPIAPLAAPAPPAPPTEPAAIAESVAVTEPEIPTVSTVVETPTTPDSTPVLPLSGRLDINNQEAFAIHASYMLDQAPYLIINMAEATFLDSSALGALVALANQARAAGGALWLVSMPPQIKNLLRLVRLDSFFEVYPNAEEAEVQRRQSPQPVAPRAANNGWSVVHLPRIFDGNNIEAIFNRCLAGLDLNAYMVVDFSETSFMSSAGMVALLKLDRAARAKNGALRIVGCSHDVLRTLKLIKLDGILTVMADVATATKDPIGPAADLSGLQAMPAGQQ